MSKFEMFWRTVVQTLLLIVATPWILVMYWVGIVVGIYMIITGKDKPQWLQKMEAKNKREAELENYCLCTTLSFRVLAVDHVRKVYVAIDHDNKTVVVMDYNTREILQQRDIKYCPFCGREL